jgi:hypothetical protein
LPHKRIQQGRFAGVGTAENADESGMEGHED